jgi:hypothetical protein
MALQLGTDLQWSKRDQSRWDRRIGWGRRLEQVIAPVRETIWNERLDGLRHAVSPFGRMSDQERREVEEYLAEVKDQKLRSEYFRTADFSRTLQSLLFDVTDGVLTKFPTLKSVVNIGAFFAYVDHRLAVAHPNLSFTAVDLVPGMAQFNAENAAPNLSFVSGYALDMFEAGQLPADVVTFSATAAEIKNRELREYMRVIAKSTKYLILSEPIYALPGSRICDPGSVSLEKSVPAYIQPDSLPHRRGPIAYVHNYRAMLEASGYKVLHYHARKLSFSELRWVDIVAQPTGGMTP